ncbi:MAG: DNA helicase RecQ [Pseudomonadota bacterium]
MLAAAAYPSPDKLDVLRDVFGFDAFRAPQDEIIDNLLNGVSVLGVMPTGAGKSLCFQVPALVLDGLTIVVSPLVALMNDQVAALRLAGVGADAIHSGQDREENVAAWRRAASGQSSILYMAPERLLAPRVLEALKELPVRLIAIDEAHCLSQWGPSFRPDYAGLGQLADVFPGVPIAAMTATADEATRKDIERQLFTGKFKTFVSGFDRPNITLNVGAKSGWKDQLLDYVESKRGQSGIVYCLSRKKTEEVAALLNGEGHSAIAYHAGLAADERRERQDRFVTEPGLIVAATIAFGMGIDKPDVRFVFHTDLPGSVEAYYQEIGRAGRDGEPAEAMMIFGAGDIRLRRQFIEQGDGDEDHKRREASRLTTLIAYAEANTCRRQTLLAYFSEASEPCGNCDNCANPVTLQDGEAEADLVFEAIFETGERYGQAHIVDVLRGAETEKIVAQRHDKLHVHGKGERYSQHEWRSIIRQMIAVGLLEVDVGGYSSLLITEAGNALTRGQGSFSFRLDEAPSRKRSTRTTKERKVQPGIDLSSRDQGLLGALKVLRLDMARERGVPAYVIFPDRTLEEIAASRPGGRDDLATVKGIGKTKLREFGDAFLDVVRGYQG